MKIFKALAYLVAAIAVSYVGVVLFFEHAPNSCQTSDVLSTLSPNKQYEARVSIEKCNNKASPSLELSLVDKSKKNKTYAVVLGNAFATDFKITWLSESKLQIIYPASFHLSQEPAELHGIKLKFAVSPSI